MAQAGACMCSSDEARYIGEHEYVRVCGRHSEIRTQRGERIITDTRGRSARHRQEAGLAGVRLADQRRLSDRFQLEVEHALFAGLAFLGDTRSTLGTGREVGVAQAA